MSEPTVANEENDKPKAEEESPLRSSGQSEMVASDNNKLVNTTTTCMSSHGTPKPKPKINVKSQLLSSNLSEYIMVEEVLIFLDRESVRQALGVKPLADHFHLTEYYCGQHGTKLQPKSVILEDGGDDDDEEDGGGGGGKDGGGGGDDEGDEDDNPKPKLACEDCVEAERGQERCGLCNDFYETLTCNECGIVICDDCSNVHHSGYCDGCEQSFCGRGECPEVKNCSRHCNISCCSGCDNFGSCKVCGDCSGCVEFGYTCGACQNNFCSGCKDNFYCDSCNCEFCETCNGNSLSSLQRYIILSRMQGI